MSTDSSSDKEHIEKKEKYEHIEKKEKKEKYEQPTQAEWVSGFRELKFTPKALWEATKNIRMGIQYESVVAREQLQSTNTRRC
eukprot:519713-Pyramimonas_sp.AAC.1